MSHDAAAVLPGRPRAGEQALDGAIVEALAYFDVYGWPLTADELHLFLPVAADRADVLDALHSSRLARQVSGVDGHHVLRGREQLVAERRRRNAESQRIWPGVIRTARMLARIPWIRMAAVSGSLAVSAAARGDDVDLFIVTEDGHLWLSRALAIAVGRVAGARGRPPLCPNYLVSSSAMELAQRDIYTAHELVQLVPLFGREAYGELLARNSWYREHLPNHPGYSGGFAVAARGPASRPLRAILDGGIVSRAERWEMSRKVARLSADTRSAETCFDAATCKGHLDGHRRRFFAAYDARLAQLEAPAP